MWAPYDKYSLKIEFNQLEHLISLYFIVDESQND